MAHRRRGRAAAAFRRSFSMRSRSVLGVALLAGVERGVVGVGRQHGSP
jgi:hypothetical protein